MASRIEQIIDEIEEYIDGCKYQALSSTKIIVNKDEMEELLNELRTKTPEEIKRYQKIISNKELVSEHQIMQQAYAQANEVVMIATKQAQEILDNATNDANNIRMGAMQYTDDILRNLEMSISHAMDSAKARHDNYMASLQEFYDVVSSNRAELNPAGEQTMEDSQATGELPDVDVNADMVN